MNTPVCKFFLQGTCKFGDSCKFSHQIGGDNQRTGASIMRQVISNPVQIDTALLVKSVVNDMNNAEKGQHWLLSSYAPFKDKPCFPGFEDRSFEEIRLGYYEAMKNGTVEPYKQYLQNLLQEAAMKVKVLQNPSNEIVSLLIQIYNTPINNNSNNQSGFSPYGLTQSNQTSMFTGSQQSSPFSSQNQGTSSIFALANQQLFNKGNSQQQQSMFNAPSGRIPLLGGGAVQSGNQNLFGQKPSLFGNQVGSGNSIFGTQNLGNAGQSPLQQSSQQNPLFGMTQPRFQSNQPFMNQTQSLSPQNQFSFATAAKSLPQPSPFGQQAQQPLFTNNPTQQNPLFQQNSGNICNNSQSSNSIFGGSTSIFNRQSDQQSTQASIFSQNSGQTVIAAVEVRDSSAYSKLEDLTESEIQSFQSESFEFGKIPEKPPTAQMCI